jgi:DNA-binding GntR family transcriptional regulator
VAPTTKRDRIVDELRRLILAGELPRGARMQQEELAVRFDASITPVREALRVLEAEGLVVGEAHRGVRVASLDVERVKAVYVVRRLVESYAMQRATSRLTRRDLAVAHRLVDEMEAAVAAEDLAGVREKNRAFHFLFYDRCGLPGLTEEIRTLWRVFPWDLLLGGEARARASLAEHREILDVVERGDLAAVAAATEAHIARGFADVASALTGHDQPDPFGLDAD